MFSGKRFGSDRNKHKFQPKRFASTQSVSDFPPLLLAADAAFQISNNPQTTTKKHKHKPLQKPGHTALRLISLQYGPSYKPILVEGNGHSGVLHVMLKRGFAFSVYNMNILLEGLCKNLEYDKTVTLLLEAYARGNSCRKHWNCRMICKASIISTDISPGDIMPPHCYYGMKAEAKCIKKNSANLVSEAAKVKLANATSWSSAQEIKNFLKRFEVGSGPLLRRFKEFYASTTISTEDEPYKGLSNLQKSARSADKRSSKLNGTIPSSFANLNKLSYLLLTGNQFSGGDLPLILSNLTSLSYFDISDNHFKSKLPSNMSGLHNLEVFRVNSNSLIGNVPTSLFTIPSLRLVSLSENQLEGPLEFGNTSLASELPYLDLASNNFNGPISESISRFLKLEFIDLSNNSFTGPIPGSMSKLVSLDDLNLSYNKLEGQVPSFLWRMSTLMLSHNSFSSFEELSQAVVNGSDSDHGSNSFQGPVQFDLGSNSLHGSLPRWICKRTSLALLDLSNNHLTGSIPSCLMNCTASLGYIILRNNNLSGFLPDIFTNATKLRSLDVSRNQLSGKLPKSLINCESMEYLNLKSLRVIDLSNNSFNGTLPQDYFVNWREMASVGEKDGFTSSDGIDTFMEHMGGGIYEDSMDMMYKGVDTEFPLILLMFKAIDFSGNKFTGRIPKSIGMLKELRHVNFSRNAFTGSIPSSLANIKNLEALDLSHNKLSGNIPRDLANLSFVSYLDFSHNLLQGPVPRSTQFQRQHCSSFEDNLGLFGLEDICGPVHATSGDSDQSEEFSSEEAEEALSWKAAAIAFGPGVFCGLVIGYIFFTSHKQTHMVHGKARLNHPGGIISVR
ncbi:hypothetical protein YC2023_070444 [Brassica napus]